ncbi:MAG: hypothetical protein ACD_46C00705G0001 [uncultured bacterium]|nr:MAG: hypothetical protein ACD_46C00705G0001 [uncultured bacterium]
MCFSLTASLAASAVLIPAGVYSVIRASRYNHRYLLFSFIPLFFGIQQFSEGMVWYGLDVGDFYIIHHASLAFLFFAFFWWPWYMPLSLFFLEEKHSQRRLILLLAIMGFLLGADLYASIVFNVIPLTAVVANKSIKYITYQATPMVISHVFSYIAIMVFSLWVSSIRAVNYFGLLILLSVIISLLFYLVVFISVWCFFAALLSLYIGYVVRTSPIPE